MTNPATPAIPRRRLGSLEVSAIGLGCMGMSDFYGPADQALNVQVLNHALDIGINLLDTSDMYGAGANESLLSQVLKTRRDDIVLASKFGVIRGENGRHSVNGRPEYVRAACDASLARLGVDHIDLYYQHRIDRNVPIEETVGVMAELVRAGKVRHIGVSEASGPTLRRAHGVHPLTALQTEYSLWTRDVEADALPTCRELGIGLVAYSPLGRGFLAGSVQTVGDLTPDDSRHRQPRFAADNLERNRRLFDAVAQLAQECGCSPAQLALAWLLHQGEDIVPIPGTRRLTRLDENAAATRVRLSPEQLRHIDTQLKALGVAGTRYSEKDMSYVNV